MTARQSLVAAWQRVKRALGFGRSTRSAFAGAQISRLNDFVFDAIIESSKAGVRKPDPRIYLMMCEALRVSPEGCVYLDDLGINCKPAAALGMAAIKVTGEAQALKDLSQVLAIDLTGNTR